MYVCMCNALCVKYVIYSNYSNEWIVRDPVCVYTSMYEQQTTTT